MNKNFIILLIYFLCILIQNNYAQNPNLMVDTTNEWAEYGSFGGYTPYPSQHVRTRYYYNGDTVLNGISYKKLMVNYIDTIFTNPIQASNNTYFYAAMRQEGQKVYFIKNGLTVENLYCDFDMEVGDTVKYYYNNGSIKVKVVSISTIPFGDTVRKRFVLDNGFSFYEGIGNNLGLFHSFGLGIEGGSYLTCFMQSNIIQYVSHFFSNSYCSLCPHPTPCKAYAGNDTALCDFEQIQLGENPIVTGGTPPYTYSWHIHNENSSFEINASDVLSNTTIANPILLSPDINKFIVKITDANNITCIDSVYIYYPEWNITLDQKIREISANTPIQLYRSVYSNSSNLSFVWTPSLGLDNPNIENPIATTDISRTYYLTVTDSMGCSNNDVFDIVVTDTKIKEIYSDNTLTINESEDNINFFLKDYLHTIISIYDIKGENLREIVCKTNNVQINKNDYKPGIYIYSISKNNKTIKTGKLFIH